MLSHLLYLILAKRLRSGCSHLLTQQVDFDELTVLILQENLQSYYYNQEKFKHVHWI